MWAGPGHEKSGPTLALPMDSVVLATQCTMDNHSTCSEMGVVDKSVNERKRVITCSCDKLYLTLLCQTCQTCNLLFFVDTQLWHQQLPSQSMYSGCPIVHCLVKSLLLMYCGVVVHCTLCSQHPSKCTYQLKYIPTILKIFLFIQWAIQKVLPFYKTALSTTPQTPLVGFLFLLELIPQYINLCKKKLDSTTPVVDTAIWFFGFCPINSQFWWSGFWLSSWNFGLCSSMYWWKVHPQSRKGCTASCLFSIEERKSIYVFGASLTLIAPLYLGYSLPSNNLHTAHLQVTTAWDWFLMPLPLTFCSHWW